MASFDPSLYLITQRSALPEGITFLDSLEESLKGGVTLVQLREKDIDTRQFLQLAIQAKSICDRYSVPLLINDRLDICLLSHSSGLHLGQSDLPIPLARSLLPSPSIIGISVNTPEEARQAVKDGADYISLGPVYWTGSKKDLKEVLGERRTRELLAVVRGCEGGEKVPVVVIGGINHSTAPHVLSTILLPSSSTSPDSTPDHLAGLAVISAIVSSPTPSRAASSLLSIIHSFRQRVRSSPYPHQSLLSSSSSPSLAQEIISKSSDLLNTLRTKEGGGGLIQHITNTVVQNDCANLCLSLSSSPIMSSSALEAADLSPLLGALVINLGTLTNEQVEGMYAAGRAANRNDKKVIFDPVGAGASGLRRESTKKLLDAIQFSIIKGNAAELSTIASFSSTISSSVKSLGVDSVGSLGEKEAAALVKGVAGAERCVVVMTGKTDYVSDGKIVLALENGHPLMGRITGSGCMTGTALAVFASLSPSDLLLAAAAALLTYTVAGELAGEREDVKGSGTFRAALVDEVGKVEAEVVRGRGKVRVVEG